MNTPAGVIGAAWEVQQRLSPAGFRFCFIGGLALQRWGEPRYTQDVVGVSLLAGRVFRYPFDDEILSLV